MCRASLTWEVRMSGQGDVTSSGRHAIDIWHVKLASGESRSLSLDELDRGFDEGWISEHTLVLAPGAIHWRPLAELAGLDETPAPVSSVPNSIAPLALDTYGADIPIDEGALDAESDAEVLAFKPRRGKKIFGFMTAVLLIGGLGFAGFRARPAVQRALASRAASRAPAALAAPVTPPPPPPVVATTPPPPPPVVASPAPIATLDTAAPAGAKDKKAAKRAGKKKP
jgi:hypothetical protein